jgi:hypothetical protein
VSRKAILMMVPAVLGWWTAGVWAEEKAAHQFKVDEDGKIEVRVTRGGELTRTFRNEDDLRQKDIRLFGKYREMLSGKD